MYQLFIIDIYLIDRKKENVEILMKKKIHSFKMEIFGFNIPSPYPE